MPYDKQSYNAKYNREHTDDIQEYNRKNTTCINVRLSNKSDADIIKFLNGIPNKVDFIRQLIRQYMTTAQK